LIAAAADPVNSNGNAVRDAYTIHTYNGNKRSGQVSHAIHYHIDADTYTDAYKYRQTQTHICGRIDRHTDTCTDEQINE
jgi:hypothetical protein